MNKNREWLQTDAVNVPADAARVAFFRWTKEQGATADSDGIIDGGACSASETVLLEPDEGCAVLPCARNVTATPGGTTANIKAVAVTVTGHDINGDLQTETLPAFTADSATTVTGAKAFADIVSVSVPAMDGAGVTLDLGFGNIYGLPYKFASKPIGLAQVDGTSKTATFAVASGKYTTVTFSTNPANKTADLVIFY